MKRIYFLALTLIITAIAATAQVSTVFDKYSDTKDVSAVYISKTMLRMIPDFSNDSNSPINAISKLDCVRVLSTANSSIRSALSADMKSQIKKENYEILLQATDDGERVFIYMKTSKDGINEYLITAEEPDELTYVQLVGTITPADVMKMNENKTLPIKK